jgi:hypothetical protein
MQKTEAKVFFVCPKNQEVAVTPLWAVRMDVTPDSKVDCSVVCPECGDTHKLDNY